MAHQHLLHAKASFDSALVLLLLLPVQDIETALTKAAMDRDKFKDRHNRRDAVVKMRCLPRQALTHCLSYGHCCCCRTLREH